MVHFLLLKDIKLNTNIYYRKYECLQYISWWSFRRIKQAEPNKPGLKFCNSDIDY